MARGINRNRIWVAFMFGLAMVGGRRFGFAGIDGPDARANDPGAH